MALPGFMNDSSKSCITKVMSKTLVIILQTWVGVYGQKCVRGFRYLIKRALFMFFCSIQAVLCQDFGGMGTVLLFWDQLLFLLLFFSHFRP